MNRVFMRGPVLAAVLAVALAALSACGDAEAPSTTTNVSVEPSRACNLVEQRRDLGAHPPELGFTLRNSDIDNFTGETELECNERQLVYWGPPPPVPGQQRPAVLVRFSFADDPEEAEASAQRSAPPGPAIDIAHGDAKLELFPGGRTFAARFVSGGAVVNVIAGCVSSRAERGSEEDLTPVACSEPPVSEDVLSQRAIEAATELERQLRGKLD